MLKVKQVQLDSCPTLERRDLSQKKLDHLCQSTKLKINFQECCSNSESGKTKAKCKSYLMNLAAFYDRVITSVEKGRAMNVVCMDVIYLDFCTAFDMVPKTFFFLNWRDMDLTGGLFSG